MKTITEFFNAAFANPYIAGIIISMLPVIELRGGIPYLYFRLGAHGFADLSKAFMCAFIGSGLVIAPLLLFFIPVINLLKKTRLFGGAAKKLESRFSKKAQKISGAETQFDAPPLYREYIVQQTAHKHRGKYLSLLIFSALPLPLTGVWSSSALAAIMQLDIKKSFVLVLLGNLICGIIVCFLSLAFSLTL